MYCGRRLFRRSPWAVLAVAAATGLFAGTAWASVTARGWDWLAYGLLALAASGLVGVAETATERIELRDDAMVVRRLTGSVTVPRSDIERIAEEKGGPPAVSVRGRWVKLPSVGSQLGSSVRAWLKETDRA